MARQRDTRAEYLADVRRARRLGFESQRQMRAARRAWKAQELAEPDQFSATGNIEEYRFRQTRMYQESIRWSDHNAATDLVAFRPGESAEHAESIQDYTKAYYKAFVANEGMGKRSWSVSEKGKRSARKRMGNPYLYKMLVTYGGMSDAEYESRYGNPYGGF